MRSQSQTSQGATACDEAVPGSFRDPDGFVFVRDGILLRQINRSYQTSYAHLMRSGLYQELVDEGLLIAHEELPGEEADGEIATPSGAMAARHAVIRPEAIPFISYPYEWSFSQLKDAALTTLAVQKKALEHDMSLKDASAYNIQFHNGRPVHIDTLSFEMYREGRPWAAYRQFCQHFLAPLSLMSYRDASLGLLLRVHLDGVPVELASRLLPARTRLSFALLTHIHLHAAAQRRFSATTPARMASPNSSRAMSRLALRGLIDNLEAAIKALKWQSENSTWADYYDNTNYDAAALEHKKRLVEEFLNAIAPAPRVVWDLGANTGMFSRLAGARQMQTIAWDSDAAAVEKNYRECRRRDERHLLPLVQDLTNPSPAIGWEGRERASLVERGPVDAAFALALVHHLALANNVPLPHIARFFSRLCSWLIIEFVPKSDSQAQRLLAGREDIFAQYSQQGFESAFSEYFVARHSAPIGGTRRTLYLMEKR